VIQAVANRRAVALIGSLVAAVSLEAQAPADSQARAGQLLYQRLPYGSQAYFSPLTVLLNKGFDHLQTVNTSRDVWRLDYERGFRIGVFDAMLHPRRSIERYPGWRQWLRTEVLPLSFSNRDAAWFVNYTDHLITGGLTYRALDEWFRVRGIPVPALLAASTTFAAAMLNEAVENTHLTEGASSTVADLYIFDLGGILLFNVDPLVRFFGGTLQGADWSNQATFLAPNGELRNTGQYYIIKVPLPATKTRLFLRGGMGVQGGLSRPVSDEYSITVALGVDTEVRYLDTATGGESIRLKVGGGVYVDRRNSLLASLNVGPAANAVTLNVFPGVLPGAGRELGTWLALTQEGHLVGGLVSRHALGLGLGLGW
jgi:hypothetical protein